MIRISTLTFVAAALLAAACSIAMTEFTPSPAAVSVEHAVEAFAHATESREAQDLEAILHTNYRAVVNDFPTSGKVTELPRTAYLDLMKARKIGGNSYTLTKRSISVVGNVANAVFDFVGNEQTMHQNLLFFRTGKDASWKLVTSAPVVSKS